MSGLIDRIRELKTEAKNQRDRGLPGYQRAVRLLAQGVALGTPEMLTSSVAATRTQLAVEIADCQGLIGGVQRRWALEGPASERAHRLIASIAAYDAGYRVESDPQYGIVDSYNLVNRLTTRLLLQPEVLAREGVVDLGSGVEPMAVPAELRTAAAIVQHQLAGPRTGNYWAMADLALLRLLLGQSEAPAAYGDFIALSPPAFAWSAVLDGVRPLAALPIDPAPALQSAVGLLEQHLQRLRS